MFSIEENRTCSPRTGLLCVFRNNMIWACCLLPGLTAAYLKPRPWPCLFKRRIATMIPPQSSWKRPGGGHTIEYLSLGILSAGPDSSMYHRGPPMIHGHSCSTFIQHTSPPGREHCKDGLPSFVSRQYEGGPEHRSFSERFYGAMPRKASHGNFPLNTRRMVTPGTARRSLSPSSLSHSLTERVPADLRSQTSQIVRALVISRWTAPHTPL
jgi:hypothetical protein